MCICCPLAVIMENKTTSASERTLYLFFCLFSPRTSSQFCRDSARSLAAAHNDGALPCNCDKSGSTGAACDPVGGQCPCRQHVIGRQCTKCATGYYGFPYCRRKWKRQLPTLLRLVSSFVRMKSPLSLPPPAACECGRRLCDEVTGRCICPPQTVKPSCEVCQTQTFSYHPLLGCEGCGCSPNGIKTDAGPDCDRITGQCRSVKSWSLMAADFLRWRLELHCML